MKKFLTLINAMIIAIVGLCQDSMYVTLPNLVLQARDVNYVTRWLKSDAEDLHRAFFDDWRDGTVPEDSTNTTAAENPQIIDLLQLHYLCLRIPYGSRGIANRIIAQLDAYNNPFLNRKMADQVKDYDRLEERVQRRVGEMLNKRKQDRT